MKSSSLFLKCYLYTSTLGCMVGESVGMVEQQYWASLLRSITMTEESVDIYYELYPCVPGRSVSLTASPALDTWKAELWTLTLCRASIYCYCLLSVAHLQLHYCIKIPCQCYVRLSSSGWIKIRYLDICVFLNLCYQYKNFSPMQCNDQ